MTEVKSQSGLWRGIGLSVMALGAVLVIPGLASSQDSSRASVTFTKDVAPIFQE